MAQMFEGQAFDGASQAFQFCGGGTTLNIFMAGSFGGGTVVAEALAPNGVDWLPIDRHEFSEPCMAVLKDAAPLIGRLRLVGSDQASVDAWVEGSLKGRQQSPAKACKAQS